mmetsp:Transcript_88473/g.270827  ORF Transcript_88473/g.270827 Transcript_88473/m.270827 type:complete len:269 (+) Transcript_88473:163-969(+)
MLFLIGDSISGKSAGIAGNSAAQGSDLVVIAIMELVCDCARQRFNSGVEVVCRNVQAPPTSKSEDDEEPLSPPGGVLQTSLPVVAAAELMPSMLRLPPTTTVRRNCICCSHSPRDICLGIGFTPPVVTSCIGRAGRCSTHSWRVGVVDCCGADGPESFSAGSGGKPGYFVQSPSTPSREPTAMASLELKAAQRRPSAPHTAPKRWWSVRARRPSLLTLIRQTQSSFATDNNHFPFLEKVQLRTPARSLRVSCTCCSSIQPCECHTRNV